ncbi:MAG TPA: DUF4307 domain-containing protein [Dermatophilaceae bacterium]|mgnify:CR=1 FL=1|nr:DUF4307 domain-containing protein [Dermatophilaceae bacterium]
MPGWRPAPGTGKWWALGVAFTLAVIGLASWQVFVVQADRITVTTRTFSIVDPRTATISFVVHKPPTTAAVCTVQAQDLRKNVVGSVQIDAPAAAERDVWLDATVKTTTEAYAVLVHDCVRR